MNSLSCATWHHVFLCNISTNQDDNDNRKNTSKHIPAIYPHSALAPTSSRLCTGVNVTPLKWWRPTWSTVRWVRWVTWVGGQKDSLSVSKVPLLIFPGRSRYNIRAWHAKMQQKEVVIICKATLPGCCLEFWINEGRLPDLPPDHINTTKWCCHLLHMIKQHMIILE